MVFVAIDKDGSEWMFDVKPYRQAEVWVTSQYDFDHGANWFELPKGSIRKLIGRELTWEDEPVELKGE